MRNWVLLWAMFRFGGVVALLPAISGCNSMGLTTSVGPSRGDISDAVRKQSVDNIHIVDLDSTAVASISRRPQSEGLAGVIGDAVPYDSAVGPGDGLSISIVEAPPAVLFGAGVFTEGQVGADVMPGGAMPEMMVDPSGRISVPFVGYVHVAGHTPNEIAQEIQIRLRAKAHLPQVSVRVVRNSSANVTVAGEVNNFTRLPLSPKGERLLDALSAAGGVKSSTNKTMIQVTRGDKIGSMPLDSIIKNSDQNIILQSGDIITALYQPYSFTVLGAASRSSEVEFEATGITLSQALGRVGGLQDQRANPKGVFLFRWEKSSDGSSAPVIYRINMKDPSMYFSMQKFYIEDKDVIYVANSSLSEFQRFAGIIASTVLPVVAVGNAVQ